MRNVVVVDGFRTPLCKEGTDFRETDADVLGAWVVREMITAVSSLESPPGDDRLRVRKQCGDAHARGQSDASCSCHRRPSRDDSRRYGGGEKLRIRSDGTLLCELAHQER